MCEKRYFLLILLCASIGAVGCRQLNPFAAKPASTDLSSNSEEIQQIKLPIPKSTSAKAAPYARSIETKPATKTKPPAAIIAAKSASAKSERPAAKTNEPAVTPATKRLDIGTPPPIVIADANSVPAPKVTEPAPEKAKNWLALSDTEVGLPEERSLAEQFAAENEFDAEANEPAAESEFESETESSIATNQSVAPIEPNEPASEVTKLPPIGDENPPTENSLTVIAEPTETVERDTAVRTASAVQLQGEAQKQAVVGFAEESQPDNTLQQPKSFQGALSAEPKPIDDADAAISSEPSTKQSSEPVQVAIHPAILQAYKDLQSDDPSSQVRACRYLQQEGSPKHIERLVPLLKSESLEVSLAATTALGSCGPWPQPKPLEEVLLNGNLPKQAAASIALCQLGSPIGPAAIEQMSHNLNPEIRAAAASAAGILADPLFTSMLIRLVDDPTVARQAALSALPRCVGQQVAESDDSASQAADKWRKWYQSGGKSTSTVDAN